MFLPNPTRKLLCYVTDGTALGVWPDEARGKLLEKIEEAGAAGVDWIQIREKSLSGRDLAALVGEALRRVPSACRILVNDRLDVALTTGAAGVHLGEQSLPIQDVKRLLNAQAKGAFWSGTSVHSLAAAQAAERGGADYLFFGPVFATPSKAGYGPPQGLERLAEVCRGVSVPVVAIGGITRQNAPSCTAAGAKGVAAIRLFQDAANLKELVNSLRS